MSGSNAQASEWALQRAARAQALREQLLSQERQVRWWRFLERRLLFDAADDAAAEAWRMLRLSAELDGDVL